MEEGGAVGVPSAQAPRGRGRVLCATWLQLPPPLHCVLLPERLTFLGEVWETWVWAPAGD